MSKSTNFLRKVYSLLLVITVIGGVLPVFAQKNNTAATNQSKQAKAKCSGAWTGVVTYTRYQTNTNNKTEKRVSGRGEDTTTWDMTYDYKARVTVLEAPEKNGSSIGKANVNHTFTSIEKVSAKEQNSCDRGKTWKEMTGDFTSKTETTGDGQNLDANVHVGINADGTYTVSVALPQIKGKTTGKQTSSYSGQCVAKEGKTLDMPPTETSIDGNSLTSDGKHRINLDDPNRLSGTFTNTFQNVTETITWTLQKCGAPLRITDMKFEHMKFPKWDDWKEISEQTGTIDGNWVKIKAKVLNASGETRYGEISFKETYKGDKWDGSKPDMPIKDQTVSVRLDAGEEREVEVLWDTSGYAWFDDGRPRLVQRVKSEIWENNKLQDDMTKNIKIAPKPVVLVHGLWSNAQNAWGLLWQNLLTTSHSYDWKAFAVGEKPEKGVMNTGSEFLSTGPTKSIAENALELEKYIKYAQEDRNAWHVDIVAHSMGGLISRQYISQLMPPDAGDFRPTVTRLIMLGTPNEGSPCADLMNFAFQMTGKDVEAVRQLQTSFAKEFNRTNTNRKGVKFSALAGNPLPVMCLQNNVWNDGVVSVPSAKWTVKDTAESKSLHTDLTKTKDFSDFVKPRLAIGPRGDHNPEAPQIPTQTGENRQNSLGAVFTNAAYKNESLAENVLDANFYKPKFAKAVKLAPKQSLEIEIPVEAANNFGLTFMADAQISATLFNDKGVIVGKNPAKTPEAGSWFRSIYTEKSVNPGTWKLKLENTSDREFEAIIATWNNAG